LRLRLAIGGLALVGAGIAAYLGFAALTDTATVCPTSGCETVRLSRYSELAGVPVALLGLGAYVAIFGSALRRETLAAGVGAAVALGGLAFGAYLLVVQIAIIDAVCVWCLASDAVLAALAVLAAARLAPARP
jgi:uncharacterized membrane protein